MKLGDPLPSLDGVDHWLQHPLRDADAAGKPVLVHFWSSGCPLCHDGMPVVDRLRKSFDGSGLVTLAVYQPRTGEPPDETRARLDLSTLGLSQPCAFDADETLTRLYANPFSPGYFFFDAEHRLRHRQVGNADLALLERIIERTV